MTTLLEVAKKQRRTTKKQKPATKKRKPVAGNRERHPYTEIAKLYNAGKSWNEISETLKIKRSSMNGISDRMAARGEIVRGKRKKVA